MAIALNSLPALTAQRLHARPRVLAGGGLAKPEVISMPSPNFGNRPGGANDIDTIVLHHTASSASAQEIGRYFQQRSAEVSSHYTVGKDGTIVQSVQDGKRAWHAGESTFKGRNDVNSYSLGIEIVNVGDNRDPYTDAQYEALIKLVAWMMQTYGVSLDRITGHRDIALPRGRKTDPSDNFDWDRVRKGVQALQQGQPPAPTRPVTPPRQDGGVIYMVREGDSLSKIAQRQLGDADRWRELYDLNREVISNPNLIYPGMRLKLPGAAASPPAPVAATPPAATTPPVVPQPPAAITPPASPPLSVVPVGASPPPLVTPPAGIMPAEPPVGAALGQLLARMQQNYPAPGQVIAPAPGYYGYPVPGAQIYTPALPEGSALAGLLAHMQGQA